MAKANKARNASKENSFFNGSDDLSNLSSVYDKTGVDPQSQSPCLKQKLPVHETQVSGPFYIVLQLNPMKLHRMKKC